MPLLVLLLYSFLPFLSDDGNIGFCEPNDCIALVERYEPLSRTYLNESQLTGLWSRTFGGMAGSNLYFFEDHSYISTWWTDVMPEIIDDKGAWKLLDGVIILSSDLDVSWETHLDRRHLIVNYRGDNVPSIIGIDEDLVNWVEEIKRYGSLASIDALKKTQRWKAEAEAKLKAKLLSEYWQPWWFECNEDPNKCPEFGEQEKSAIKHQSE